VTALHGTIPLKQMQDIAVPVAKNLDFDVLRPANVPLQKDGIVPKCSRSLLTGLSDASVEIFGAVDYPHAAPAAPEGCLHD
jgi:hypothetical protein